MVLRDGIGADQRSEQGSRIERVADLHPFVRGLQLGHHRVGDPALHEHAPSRGAALSGGSDGSKHDRARSELEIRVVEHDDAVVATELEQRTPEPCTDPRGDVFPRGDRSGEGDERQSRIVGDPPADIAAAQRE